MTQIIRVSGVFTDIFTDKEGTHVTYRGTRVVSFTDKTITLRSGGHLSQTTKRRMKQTANQFGLGFSVYAVNFEWFVDYQGETIPFTDGMVLKRKKA